MSCKFPQTCNFLWVILNLMNLTYLSLVRFDFVLSRSCHGFRSCHHISSFYLVPVSGMIQLTGTVKRTQKKVNLAQFLNMLSRGVLPLVYKIFILLQDDSSLISAFMVFDDQNEESALLRRLNMGLISEASLKHLMPKVTGFAEITTLQLSDQHFKEHFRLERKTFDSLLEILLSETNLINEFFPHELRMVQCEQRGEVVKKCGKTPIRLRKALLVTFWYLANKESMRCIANLFGISKSSVHSLVHRIVIMLSSLAYRFIKWPSSQEDYVRLEHDFYLRSGFPKVIAAIDGCHINIIAPADQEEAYRDRKHNHSITLQGVCSAEKMFLNINVGFPGSAHDARVFRNSSLYIETSANIKTHFPSDDYHMVGDSAYPVLSWLLTPYKEPPSGRLTLTQKRYNLKHSQTRVVIEHTFGLLKTRFRKLHLVDTQIEFIPYVVTACCVLHNICESRGDTLPEWWKESGNCNSGSGNNGNTIPIQSSRVGFQKRDRICATL